MAKAEKILEDWKRQIPSEARWEEVRLVLDEYFSGWRYGSQKSHVVVYHTKMVELIKEKGFLNQLQPFNYLGEFTVVVKKHKVKGVYVQSILKALEILEVMRWIR
ncbi:MAG: hypothetical protein A2V67_10190 [Deltaproteobacteria bacterium RBG_13_61_14]|nr:MAG: hypothetical protein A2V67_10190 [Deltaproteobacteria bacterium RBG_13_61_14]